MWKIEQPLNLSRLYYPEEGLNHFKNFNEKLYSEKLEFRIKDRENIIQLLKEQPHNNELERHIMLLDFFSNEVGRIDIVDDNDYKLSNFYAQTVFERTRLEDGSRIDGIIYPSVPFSYQGMNVALTKEGFKKMRFIAAMYVWVTYFENSGDSQFIPVEQRIYPDSNGVLQWNLFKEDFPEQSGVIS